MRNNIINTFQSEKELFEMYPKKFHWDLKDIFTDYWDGFLEFAKSRNLNIRPVCIKEVNKMMICKTKALGYSVYECHDCHKTKIVYTVGASAAYEFFQIASGDAYGYDWVSSGYGLRPVINLQSDVTIIC